MCRCPGGRSKNMPAGPLSSALRWRTSTARPACKAEARIGAAAQQAMARKRGACCLQDPSAKWGRHRPLRVRIRRKLRARCNAVGCRTTKESKCTPTTMPLGESAWAAMVNENSTARSVNVRVVFSANCRIRALSILRHRATLGCDMFDNALISGRECQVCFDSCDECARSRRARCGFVRLLVSSACS